MDAFLVRTNIGKSDGSDSKNMKQTMVEQNNGSASGCVVISPKTLKEDQSTNMDATRDLDASSLSLLKKENDHLRSEDARLLKEVKQLRTENSKLKNDSAIGVVSKKRKSNEADRTGGSIEPANKKFKTPAQRKKLLEKWHKALKRESARKKITNAYGGESYSVEIKETVPWSKAEMEALFDGGNQIQPTPQNKPTSVITILRYDFEQMKKLFMSGIPDFGVEGDYSVQLWRARNFCKSYRQGTGQCKVDSMEVHWNKSKQQLSLKFDMTFLDAC